jgi:succinoglycan biosynthesis protein ExoA
LRQLAVPAHLALSIGAVLLSPWFAWLLLWPLTYLLALGTAALGFAVQKRSSCALWCGYAALVMHTAWAIGFFAGLMHHRERVWAREMAVPLRLRVATGDGT